MINKKQRGRLGPAGWSWGLGFGLSSASVAWGTRYVDETSRSVLLIVICSFGLGAAAYLALRPAKASLGRNRQIAVAVWAAVGAIAMAANVYLALHPFARSIYSEVEVKPVEGHPFAVARRVEVQSHIRVHLWWTMPIVGALGGAAMGRLIGQVARKPRSISEGTVLILGGAAVWALAFSVGGQVSFYGYYLFVHSVSDISESLGLGSKVGILLGGFLGGWIGGWIAGFIGRFAPGMRFAPTEGAV